MRFSKRQMIGVSLFVVAVGGVGLTWLMNRGPSNAELYQQTVENLNKLPQELCANRGHWSLKFLPEDNFVHFSRTGMQGVLKIQSNSGEPEVSQVQIQRGPGALPISVLPLTKEEQRFVLEKINEISKRCLSVYQEKQKEQNQQPVDPGPTGSVNNSSEFYAYVELGSPQHT